ncbi:MAG: methyltransferase domain-containing protein, partial [Desulfobacterales bacterium]
MVQIISDVASDPLENLRILDLGCLEGLFAIELAQQGSKVVGIEGREANIEKARFAKDVLGLNNLELILDDVRNLSKEKYGRFDVVLCLGLLYHLGVPDVFAFAKRMGDVCERFAIIDTHVSLVPEESHVYDGRTYWGCTFQEHSSDSTSVERARALWSSLDNVASFWFTRASLFNLLSYAGFTSVYECPAPPALKQPYDRITVLAIK